MADSHGTAGHRDAAAWDETHELAARTEVIQQLAGCLRVRKTAYFCSMMGWP